MRVELQHVTKRFGPVRALDDVSLTLASGRAVALVGPNGSGKSTLTRALMGLIAHEGEVLVDGRPRASRVELARRLAYVPQIAPRFEAPVGELVRAVARVRGTDPAAFGEVTAALELDISSVWKRPLSQLSGGMKQKVLIALALAPGADFFLMDEPTASLDAAARQRFFRLFAERRGDATLLLCSHRLEEMRHLVDDVVVLREGRVAWQGPVGEFLAQREQSVLELHVHPVNGDASWLRRHGFEATTGSWWHKQVGREEKLSLLPRAADALGTRLVNLVVRDLERVEMSRVDASRDQDPARTEEVPRV